MVGGAPELEDLHGSAPLLLLQAISEEDDVIGHKLLNPPAPYPALFGRTLHRDQGRDAEPPQPRGDTVELAADDVAIGQLRKQRADGIQHDALGSHRTDRVLNSGEERREIIGARGDGLLPGLGSRIDDGDLLAGQQTLEVPAKRTDVLHEVAGGFLEGHEDAVLTEVPHASEQELEGHHRLATAGGPGEQGASLFGDPAVGDLIETHDSRSQFGQLTR